MKSNFKQTVIPFEKSNLEKASEIELMELIEE